MLGLELGADDYITKPFSMREFRSRVQGRAAARRDGRRATAGERADRARASCEIDFERRVGRRCAASRSQLTYVEFEILAALAARARAASSPARCCSSASGATPPTATRARSTSTSATCARSSSPTPKHPEYLFTVRGVGYRFRDEDSRLRQPRSAAQLAPQPARRSCSSLITAAAIGVRLPLRRAAARVEPDRREAAPARAGSATEQSPRLAAGAASRRLRRRSSRSSSARRRPAHRAPA